MSSKKTDRSLLPTVQSFKILVRVWHITATWSILACYSSKSSFLSAPYSFFFHSSTRCHRLRRCLWSLSPRLVLRSLSGCLFLCLRVVCLSAIATQSNLFEAPLIYSCSSYKGLQSSGMDIDGWADRRTEEGIDTIGGNDSGRRERS